MPEDQSVKRFERTNGLDIALFKTYIYLSFLPTYEVFPDV